MSVLLSLSVNGKSISIEVDPRTLLVDFIRNKLALTGTHVGCDTGQCGACTILIDGNAVKACTILAVQASGSNVTTIEGLAANGELHPMQAAFKECHGLQCGFCTPGMVMSAIDLVGRHPSADEATIRAESPAVAAATWTSVPRWIPATEARPTRRPCSALWKTT